MVIVLSARQLTSNNVMSKARSGCLVKKDTGSRLAHWWHEHACVPRAQKSLSLDSLLETREKSPLHLTALVKYKEGWGG